MGEYRKWNAELVVAARRGLPKLGVAVLLAGFAAQTSRAADECGAENLADIDDTVTCAAGSYTAGITYSGSDGMNLVLDDAGISTTNAGVSITASPVATGRIDLYATNFGTVATSASGAHGLSAAITNAASNGPVYIRMQAGTVITSGDQAFGLYASTNGTSGATAHMEGGLLTTSGTGAMGIVAESTHASSSAAFAHAIQTGGVTTVTGDQSVGLYAHVASSSRGIAAVSVDGTAVVLATGAGSDGVRAVVESATAQNQIYIAGSARITGGSGSGVAIRSDGVAGSDALIFVVDDAVVDGTAGAAAIQDGAGDATVMVDATVRGAIRLGLGDDVLQIGIDDPGFPGVPDTSGLTLLDGGGGNDFLGLVGLTLTRPGSFFSGWEDIVVGGGSLTITDGALSSGLGLVLIDNAILDGGNGLALSGGLNIYAGSVYQATGGGSGLYSISTFLTHNGTITMADNAVGDALTVSGDYTGTGTLMLDIDTATATADTLTILGDASGTTGLSFNNLSANAANGQDILLVTVAGSSTGDNFALIGGPLTVGAYFYDLAYTGSSFVLDATLNPTGATYEAAPLVLAGFSRLPSMMQRHVPATGSGAQPWARVFAGKFESALDSGSAVSSQSGGVQAGVDFPLTAGSQGRWALGFSGQYGSQNASISGLAGKGDISAQGFSLGLSATWQGDGGTYVDTQAQFGWLSVDYSSESAGTLAKSQRATAVTLGIEAGHRFALGHAGALVPQAQLTWGQTSAGGFTDSVGNDVVLGDNSGAEARLGLAYEFGREGGFQGYVIGNILHSFANGTSVEVGTATLAASPAATWAELGVGGRFNWGGQSRFYVDASYRTALGSAGQNNGLAAGVGLEISW